MPHLLDILEYFPLKEENWWLFATDEGNIRLRVAGKEVMEEGDCYILQTEIHEETLQKENYLVNENGVWLYARNFQDSVLLYEPPYPVLMGSFSPGKIWVWEGLCGESPMEIKHSILERETVAVPAGTFSAIKVRIEEKSSLGEGISLRWYAAGVGIVKEQSSSDFMEFVAELEDFQIEPPEEGDILEALKRE